MGRWWDLHQRHQQQRACPCLSPPRCSFCQATVPPGCGDTARLPSLANPCRSYSNCSHRHIFLALRESVEQLGSGTSGQDHRTSRCLPVPGWEWVAQELAEPVLGQPCSVQGLIPSKGALQAGLRFLETLRHFPLVC